MPVLWGPHREFQDRQHTPTHIPLTSNSPKLQPDLRGPLIKGSPGETEVPVPTGHGQRDTDTGKATHQSFLAQGSAIKKSGLGCNLGCLRGQAILRMRHSAQVLMQKAAEWTLVSASQRKWGMGSKTMLEEHPRQQHIGIA